MLLSGALSCRALPFRATKLISEYSKPMTKPDWRKSKPIITTFRLYIQVQYLLHIDFIPQHNLLHHIILCNIVDTDWYYLYYYICHYGLSTYTKNSLDVNKLTVDGIEDAQYCYQNGDFTYG
jgi:hypothetical protein